MRLLVTRPEPDGDKTAARLRACGHAVTVAPLLHVESLAEADLGTGPWAGVIVTSANAARALMRHPRRAELCRLPAFAVGARTAAAAHDAGFAEVVSADGDAGDLVRMILARREARGRALLYLAGADLAADISGELRQHGVPVDTVTIYRAVEAHELPAAVQAALEAGQIDGVLHFSKRSAEIYLNSARRAGVLDSALRPSHYCLSAQVAEPLSATGALNILIAARPEEAALLELIEV